jgi:hypothetical protein
LKATSIACGYSKVTLYRGAGTKPVCKSIHRLVLEAFAGPAPEGTVAAHTLSNNKSDNRFANLRWASPKENNADKFVHGTAICGSQIGSAKLTESDIPKIRQLCKTTATEQIAELYKVSHSTIRDVVVGKTWTRVPVEGGDTKPVRARFGGRGSRVHSAKLTEADIPSIRRLIGTTTGIRIAAIYGVSPQTISKIAKGHRWKHIPIDADRPAAD